MSAPTGCSLSTAQATCSYSTWLPPLMDANFSTSPTNTIVNNIDGTIPSNAFNGLGSVTQMSLDCGFGNGNNMNLLTDSLTSNLAYVDTMLVSDCNNMEIADGAFSALTSLATLTIIAGNFTSISGTAFYNLTSLSTLYVYADFPASGVPSGLFAGLEALADLDMSRTNLYSLPADLFSDLKNLTDLNLQDTGLVTLPDGIFAPLFGLTTLDLTDNNWVCDCNLKWIVEYLVYAGLSATGATCASPANLAGLDLQRALISVDCTATTAATTNSSSDDEYRWWYRYGLIGGCGLALFVAAIAVAAFIYQHDKMNAALRKLSAVQKSGSSAAYTNPAMTTEYDTVAETKQTKLSTISNQSNTGNASPFNKRSRMVSPAQKQNAWARQAQPEPW